MRPDDNEENALLYPSRRTKMTLRIPLELLDEAEKLYGTTLDISGHPLQVGSSKKKIFTNASVIFSRYASSKQGEDETSFYPEWQKS